MIKWLLVNTISLLILTRLLPGFLIDDWTYAILAVLVMGIVNITIKPLISLLTLPITFLTLGLFSIVINTLMFLLVAYITPGFRIDGFLTALIASLLHSLITGAINSLTSK
jgi:putative membrane protein